MKDVPTGKTFLTQHTKEVAGRAFAKAGYNVDNLVEERQILAAWANTLSDAQADNVLDYLMGNSGPISDEVEHDPAAVKLRLVK